MEEKESKNCHKKFFSKGMIITCLVLAVIGILLLTGHKTHLYGYLPFLLILACPLMHIFMHGGHNHNEEKNANTKKEADK